MPFIRVPNTLGVQIVFTQAGQVVENTVYFVGEDGWSLAAATAFLSDLRTLVEEELMPLLHTSISLIRLIATLLDAVDGFAVTNELATPVTGSDNGDPLPNQIAYAITFKTTSRGRAHRGRNYIAGLNSNVMATPNTVTDAFRTGLLAYYDAMSALATSAGAQMVVVSRFSGVDGDGHPIPRAVGIVTPIDTFGTADFNVDTMRRRAIGVGA
jgi:hypothetical protein